MIRFLIRLVIWFLAAFIGIIAADLLLSGSVSYTHLTLPTILRV